MSGNRVRSKGFNMDYRRKEHIFSHKINSFTEANQPVMFKIDLRDLVPPGDYSSLFTIDSMTVTAYKRDTYDKIPVKFTVLNETKNRILTNDLERLSSPWQVELNGALRDVVKIAGTDSYPFKRTFSVYDEESRQAIVNVLSFMMSYSLCFVHDMKGALEILTKSMREEFRYSCGLCKCVGIARIKKGNGCVQSISFPQCLDGNMCSTVEEESDTDPETAALVALLTFLRIVCLDDLSVLHQFTQDMAASPDCCRLDCAVFPPKNDLGDICIPYTLMIFATSLYEFMSDYADNFAVVDKRISSIRVLIESPAENVGLITGVLSLTLLNGVSVSDIHSRFSKSLEDVDINDDQLILDHEGDLPDAMRLGMEVLIRRKPMNFKIVSSTDMTLQDWYNYYYFGAV